MTLERLIWVSDLTLNIRATGWSHGGDKCLPFRHPRPYRVGEPFKITQPYWALREDRKRIRNRCAVVMLFVYVWLDAFQLLNTEDGSPVWPTIMSVFDILGIPLSPVIRQDMPGLICAIASVVSLALLLEAIHAFSIAVGVCLLTSTSLGTWGEAWMYPPLTGSRQLSKFNVQGLTLTSP
ncbi:hypothetical protein BDV23DRAFT_182842 [Aspergillus alliaceus]|uniref:Uncharacterized protein n=1 Tax=Petromyces alliaceus TaxID=209559 RepID=A0A5N7CAF2_PETAA|nr:hypothetical protein BDV23DRAFT_182842 [Aspergillus alliaceus]